ncbi:GEVED domain-containing protein [Winogradskyella sp.]|uniref:GEVED domain-containing protein n=1 Tax=Winogradskyella sp. TaxID=1883156 RepID=UPI003F6C0AD6
MHKKILLFAVFTVFIHTQVEAQYCTPSSTDPAFFIDGFSTTGAPVDISNLNSGFSTGGYGDFTGMAVTQVAGGTINFSIVSPTNMESIIWVDWNNDFDFDDAGEEVFNGNATTNANGSFNIPGGTANGNYRMRVRGDRTENNVSNCGFDDRSEAEDYTLIVGTPPNCIAPVNQPTALTFGTITGSSISASFTAATADSYLVLMNTTGTAPAAPVNVTNYAIGSVVLGGNTVIDNDSNLSFTASGLNASSQYYFFIYAFNNSNCVNGPVYNATAPLTGNDTTTGTTYCTPTAGATSANFIDLFESTGGVTNFSNATDYTPGGYTDYTATQTVSQTAGQNIDFVGNFNTGDGMGAGVWIDLNNDGDFLDADEEIFNSAGYIGGFAIIYSIPPGLAVGTYRIRVLADLRETTPASCVFDPTGPIGEAEDYTLEVLPLPCGDDPSNVAVSAVLGTSATISWEAAAPAPGTGYEYLVTTNTNPPNFNLPGTGTTNNSTTFVNVTGLNQGTTYYVWVRSVCGGGDGSGQWIGPETFSTPAIPPTTAGVTICTGEASQDLTASGSCSVTINLGSSLTGAIDAATSPVALNPDLPILGGGSEPNCGFTTGTSTYDTIDFSVDVTGVYIFTLATPVPYFDAMGYLVLGDGLFVPGSCATGTWILGDDDSGPALQPQLNVTLTAGVTYTLITSKYGSGVTHTGTYTWNMTGPGSLFGGSNGVMEWYTTPIGGTPIATGDNFDPVGLPGSGLTNTNTAGTYSFWAACSGSPGTRTQADFVINEIPTAFIDGRGSICDESVNLTIDLTGTAPWTFTYTNGTTPVTVTNYAGSSPYTFSVVPNASDTYTVTALSNATCIAQPGDLSGSVSFAGDKTWDGSTNTDWATASNWTPEGVPTNADAITIPSTANNPIINGTTDGKGCSLIIQNGATLIQQANSTLTITKDIVVDAGGVYAIEDTGSLIQVNDVANTVNGTFTMDRTANMRLNDYVYWSSPVDIFNVENISPGTPNGFKYEWVPTLFQGIGPPGNMTFGEWQGYNTGAMDIGKGYIIRGPNGYPAAPSPFTATFNGTPNNGVITQAIVHGDYTGINYTFQPIPGGDNLLVTADDDNWNLVGNPYPSAIDAIDFLNLPANSFIDGFVYLWTHGTDIGAGNPDPFYDDFVLNYNVADYIAYNSAGVSTPVGFNGNIAAGQGFFVLMNDTGTTTESVTFDNSMRSSAHANDQFYRNSDSNDESTENKHSIWLDYLSPSGETNTTLIAYVNGATNSEDRMYDAKTTQGNGLNLYSLINDDTYLIQGRQLPFLDTDEVPLGLNITEAGIQTIGINTLQGLFNDNEQDIYIDDLVSGVTHNLRNSPYTFTSETGIINDRFILRFTNNRLNIATFDTSSGIKVFEDEETVIVKSYYQNIESIEVYDILGRTLFSNQLVNDDYFSINTLEPSDSALFVRIKLIDGKEKIEKIIF